MHTNPELTLADLSTPSQRVTCTLLNHIERDGRTQIGVYIVYHGALLRAVEADVLIAGHAVQVAEERINLGGGQWYDRDTYLALAQRHATPEAPPFAWPSPSPAPHRRTPQQWRVVKWTGEDEDQVVRQVICHESELGEVIARPFPAGAVAREAVERWQPRRAEEGTWTTLTFHRTTPADWGLPVGDITSVEANQGQRDALVLAQIGPKRLVEYEMPSGTTALRIIDLRLTVRERSVSYWQLSRAWLEAVVDGGLTWTGRPQQAKTPPSPAELLAQRTTIA